MTDENNNKGPAPLEGETHVSGEVCDESLRCLCSSMFHGRLRWLAMVGVVYGVVFTAAAVVTAIMFFRVDTIRSQVLYAVLFGLSAAFMAMTEMWFWSMMWRNSLAMRLDRLDRRLLAMGKTSAGEHVGKPGQAA